MAAGRRGSGGSRHPQNEEKKVKLFIQSACVCIVVAVISAGPLTAGEQPAAKRKLNVLFIMSDDLNTRLGCYDDPLVKTPNIDALAARGMRFDRAYCQFPLCGPSRNSMLTGLYPNSNGILVNAQIFRQTVPKQFSLPQAFRLAGYFAGRIGKLYHYGVPTSIGTNGHDDPASWELELNPPGVDRMVELRDTFSLRPGNFGGTLSWRASPHPDELHTDALQAAEAEWVLERCAKQKDRPFFLAVGFFRPHTPYISPNKYFEKYRKQEMPLVENVEQDRANKPPLALRNYGEQPKLNDDLRRQAMQAYFASVTFMDAQLGRLMSALDRLGLADSTVIVFCSDHGYHLGEHGMWQKMSIYEESARVPLLIVAPGTAQKGSVSRAPVGLIDLYPTLTELCGVEAPDNLQGQSLVPLLKDPSAAGRGWALSQVTRGGGNRPENRIFGYSIRTPRWRYTEWDSGQKGRELYDHKTDPQELKNLVDDAAHKATVTQMADQLQAAVKASFPASGETPSVSNGMWAPTLTGDDRL
jgi:iduronate 2-sulfatase